MQAVFIQKTGGPDVLEFTKDFKKPDITIGQVCNSQCLRLMQTFSTCSVSFILESRL